MKQLLLCFLLFAIKASAQVTITPVDYNDRLAAYTDTLYGMGQAWGTAFNQSYKSGDYSPLKDKSDSMERFINKAIVDITNMQDLNDSKPLRQAMIGFLKFEKTMVGSGFHQFESFTAKTPVDTVQAALDRLTILSKEETAYLDTVTGTQEVYAKQNGFSIAAKKD
jgi:hypothetical protein